MNQAELVAALPRHAPNPQGTERKYGGTPILDGEQVESKSKGENTSINTAELPLFGLAGQADKNKRKERSNHTSNERNGKVGRPGLYCLDAKFLTRFTEARRVIVAFVIARANVEVGQRSIAQNVLVNFPPVDGPRSDIPGEGVRFG